MTLIAGWQGKKVKCPGCDTVSIAGQPLPAGPQGEVIRFPARSATARCKLWPRGARR
jgi:hypothetical protein